MDYALNIRPLSRSFQQRLEAELNTALQYLSISDLRRYSSLQLWKFVRKLPVERLYLPLEDANSELLLPVLKIASIIIPAKKIIIVHPDLNKTIYRKYKVLKQILQLLRNSFVSYISYLRCRKELYQLSRSPSTSYSFSSVKKALYLNANLWVSVKAGGSVGHISGVANELCNRGYSVDYACVSENTALSPRVQFIKLQPPPLFAIPLELNYFHFNHQLVKQLSTVPEYRFIYQRLSIENYAGVRLSRRLQIPLVIEYNGSEVWIADHWGKRLRYHSLAQRCELTCFKHAHLIVTISEALKERLIEIGVPSHKIVCHPNGIDPSIFNPSRFTLEDRLSLRQQYHIPHDALVFTFIGTFGTWHGVEVLSSAIKIFIEKYRDIVERYNIRFLMVGDGSKRIHAEKILSFCSEFVIFTGLVNQEEAPLYLHASDVLLSPHVPNSDGSKFFGSPTKLFEYMAMNKPIIASNLDQIGQVLQPHLSMTELFPSNPPHNAKECALLCQPGNADHIVNAMRFLTQHPDWRLKLGDNARKIVLEKYTWKHHVDAILKKLDEIPV